MKLSLWKYPKTGQIRIYIEGVGNALKVWLVQSPPDVFGSDYEVQSNGGFGDIPQRFCASTGDRISALLNVVEKAITEAGLPRTAKWNDVLAHLGAAGPSGGRSGCRSASSIRGGSAGAGGIPARSTPRDASAGIRTGFGAGMAEH